MIVIERYGSFYNNNAMKVYFSV